jgi:hypothetical protein
LKKVEASGGAPQIICDVKGVLTGAAWSRAGVIVYGIYASSDRTGLWKVSAAGGVPTQITHPSLESTDNSPAFLPDGAHFLYQRVSGLASMGAYLGSVTEAPEKPVSQPLLAATSQAEFVQSANQNRGYLLFVRARKFHPACNRSFQNAWRRPPRHAFKVWSRLPRRFGIWNGNRTPPSRPVHPP